MDEAAPVPLVTLEEPPVVKPKHAGGRPKGTPNATTTAREKAKAASENGVEAKKEKREQLEDIYRAQNGSSRRSSTGYLGAKILKSTLDYDPISSPVLERVNHVLSDDAIRIAIRVLIKLHDEAMENNNGSTYGMRIFERASEMLAMGETKLYELWDFWVRNPGTLPPSTLHGARNQKVAIVLQRFSGHIRAFLIRRKNEGKVVEVPDVQKFLVEVLLCDVIYKHM